MKSIDFREVIKPEMTFAVRAERIGEHSFTSIDVARIAGQAVIDSYLDTSKVRLKVNLDNPDVEVNVLVRFDEILVGINTSGSRSTRGGTRSTTTQRPSGRTSQPR